MDTIRHPLVHWASKVNEWVGRVISFLLFPITFITALEVFMRYVVKKPTIWAWDLNIQLNAALIMLGGGYTLLEKWHVAVDILVTSIPPRRRAILDLVTSFFFFFGFVILLWYGWDVAWASWKAREAMPTVWAPPYYPIKMLVPIGAFLMLIQGVAKLIQDFQRVRERREGDPS